MTSLKTLQRDYEAALVGSQHQPEAPAVLSKAVMNGQTYHLTFPILKMERTPDGDLVVYGKCTDGTVDEDHQRVDSRWSGKALQDWLNKGANIRVQHSPFLYPAGKGMALEIDKDGKGGHWLRALVAHDTPACGLVEKRILRDFSIGILDPVITYGDPMAPGGTIVGGHIGEVSLVDRGSNKNASFEIVKASKRGRPRVVQKMRGTAPESVGAVMAHEDDDAEFALFVLHAAPDRATARKAIGFGGEPTTPEEPAYDQGGHPDLAHLDHDPDFQAYAAQQRARLGLRR